MVVRVSLSRCRHDEVDQACPTRVWFYCCWWCNLWIIMNRIADVAISRPRHVCKIDALRRISTTYTMLMLALMVVMMSIGIQWRSVHFHAADSIIVIIFISSSSLAGTERRRADPRKIRSTVIPQLCRKICGPIREFCQSADPRSSTLSLYHNCDSTAIRLRHDYDEKLTCSFFARVEWKQARAIRRSRIVVVS